MRVYQCARIFARNVHRATRTFPDYLRTLAAQLDDAVESIGSNIAEGCGRKNRNHGNAELIRYLHFSFSSACEAEHRIAGAHDRGLIEKKRYWQLDSQARVIKKMLAKWIRSLQDRDRGRKQE
jgi:four helix bundle protein